MVRRNTAAEGGEEMKPDMPGIWRYQILAGMWVEARVIRRANGLYFYLDDWLGETPVDDVDEDRWGHMEEYTSL